MSVPSSPTSTTFAEAAIDVPSSPKSITFAEAAIDVPSSPKSITVAETMSLPSSKKSITFSEAAIDVGDEAAVLDGNERKKSLSFIMEMPSPQPDRPAEAAEETPKKPANRYLRWNLLFTAIIVIALTFPIWLAFIPVVNMYAIDIIVGMSCRHARMHAHHMCSIDRQCTLVWAYTFVNCVITVVRLRSGGSELTELYATRPSSSSARLEEAVQAATRCAPRTHTHMIAHAQASTVVETRTSCSSVPAPGRCVHVQGTDRLDQSHTGFTCPSAIGASEHIRCDRHGTTNARRGRQTQTVT